LEEHSVPDCLLCVPIDDIALDGGERGGRGLCIRSALDLFTGEPVLERGPVPAERGLVTVVGLLVAPGAEDGVEEHAGDVCVCGGVPGWRKRLPGVVVVAGLERVRAVVEQEEHLI
jgi:hypothetical protein